MYCIIVFFNIGTEYTIQKSAGILLLHNKDFVNPVLSIYNVTNKQWKKSAIHVFI